MATHPTVDSAGTILPSEGMRTTITFLLIVHFTMLGCGWLMLSSPEPQPALFSTINDRVFKPYLRNFWLEIPYDYYLTNGGRSSVGSLVTVTETGPAAANLSKTTIYPPVDGPRDARRAYVQHLIDLAAQAAQNRNFTETKTIMDLVAGAILRDTGAKSLEIHLRAPLDDRDEGFENARNLIQHPVTEKDLLAPNSRYEVLSRAKAIALDGGGWIFTDVTQSREAAPVAGDKGSPTPQPTPQP